METEHDTLLLDDVSFGSSPSEAPLNPTYDPLDAPVANVTHWYAKHVPEASGAAEPQPRRNHTTVLYRGKLITWGGWDTVSTFAELWACDVADIRNGVANWQRLIPNGFIPNGLAGHSSALVNDQIVIFGGKSPAPEYSNRVCCLDLSSLVWCIEKDDISINAPLPCVGHRCVVWEGAYYVVGGRSNAHGFLGDIRKFDLSLRRWHTLHPRIIVPRYYHSMTLVAPRGKCYIIGGSNGLDSFNDVHEYDFNTNVCTQLYPAGGQLVDGVALPTARSSHGAEYLWAIDSLIILGGFNGKNFNSDLCWILSLKSIAWVRVDLCSSPHSGIKPRLGYGMTLTVLDDGESVVAFGGYCAASPLATTATPVLGEYTNELWLIQRQNVSLKEMVGRWIVRNDVRVC